MRAKLKLRSITYFEHATAMMTFDAVNDRDTPEEQRFNTQTPEGKFEISIDNPEALEQFIIGKEYHIDFTAVK
ncbi:MAG: hypothetical protein JKX94_04800 [Sneathiella sp.]|nr:hypothetical protein [Sneathiella sp.]